MNRSNKKEEQLNLHKKDIVWWSTGLFFLIYSTHMLPEHRNYSQSLLKFINFGFLGLVHNLSIRLIKFDFV